MNRPAPDGGGTYSSIDPTKLQGAATALTKTASGITSSIVPLRDRFATGGVSTSHLDKLGHFASTISDLGPELTRRISLAQFACSQHPEWNGVAHVSDDLGDFTTTAAAQAAAKKIADDVKKNGLSDATLKDIQDHGLDPDYAEALVKNLGGSGVLNMLRDQQLSLPDDKVADDPSTQVLANMLATASYRCDFDYPHIKGSLDGHAYPDPLYIMAPYIQKGVWSEKALTQMADIRFKGTGTDDDFIGNDSDQRVEQSILKGLANNPVASAHYFANNHDTLYPMMRNEKMLFDGTKSAWASFVHSATIDSRDQMALQYLDKPGDNPAIKNAEWLMKKVAGDGDDWYGEMTDTFAAMSSEYMDDYARTLGSSIDVGSVTDPGHDGVSVSTADWQKFLKTSMSTNEGIKAVGYAMKAKIDQLRISVNQAEVNSPSDSAQAAFWDRYTMGAMQSTFLNLFSQVASDRDKDAEDQRNMWKGLVDKGISLAMDPKGFATDVGVDGLKDLIGMAIDATVKATPMPSMPDGDFDVKQGFAKDAIIRLATNPDFAKDQKLPFKTYDDGDVTWDGNPTLYTHPSPPNGDFTQYIHDGEMSDDIKKDPAAWSSYNEWLHDPAVQNAVSDGFDYEETGGLQGK
ncbi:hypothetical protein D9V37_14185 [Nocardioides mangrovicus]|uniref:Uncharacterized protein n=1 Tax=Nocardioides mangrovicus TaxID=2478913 RepID=A0A3L8NZA9_9ACTN|nr:hypothetical protein [Nocardioides mangrovicus]RLV48520.1 hypothetical protein D9V37_14185 [Nocardioides mangrovicus]